jgi:AcrR family transcriptional regulator
VGNRDALLAGALECLMEDGYARSTARAITARAGTSLAAIGYHFGSTEHLLHEAIAEGFRQWRTRLALVLEEHEGAAPGELVGIIGDELTRLFVEDRRLLIVFVEALALAERSDDVQAQAAAGYVEDRLGVAGLLERVRGRRRGDEPVVGSMLLAVVDGLVIQHLLNPDDAPSPRQVLDVLAPVITGGPSLARKQRNRT